MLLGDLRQPLYCLIVCHYLFQFDLLISNVICSVCGVFTSAVRATLESGFSHHTRNDNFFIVL